MTALFAVICFVVLIDYYMSTGCTSLAVGMASGSIPNRDITASSALNSDSEPFQARLQDTKAWIPRSDDKHPWIQVNLQYSRNMTAIATQGFNGSFVKSYYVSYGDDGINWKNYTVQGKIKVFKLRSRFNILFVN